MTDTTNAAAETTPEPSMADTMSEVFDEMASAEAEGVETEQPEAPPAEEQVTEAAEETTDQQPGEETETAAEAAVDVPRGWSSEMKEAWAALPEHVRDYVTAREDAVQAKLSEQGRMITTLKPIGETLDRYRQTFEARGLDANTAMQAMFDAQARLDANPVAGLQHIAQMYGVDLSQLSGRPEGKASGTDTPDDPNTSALRHELATLKQQLATINNESRQERAAREARELQESQAQIEKWAKGRDHFEAVREDMARMIQSGLAQGLDDAYEKATWANPEIRKQIEATEKAKAAEKAAKDAEAAKKRSKINVGKTGNLAAPKAGWRDTLRAAYDEVEAGR